MRGFFAALRMTRQNGRAAYIPPIAMGLRWMGHPARFEEWIAQKVSEVVAGRERRGSFDCALRASLRMTTETNNHKNKYGDSERSSE
jgi:hypothetical protein